MLYLCCIYAIFKHSISANQKTPLAKGQPGPELGIAQRILAEKMGGKGENLYYFVRSPLASQYTLRI